MDTGYLKRVANTEQDCKFTGESGDEALRYQSRVRAAQLINSYVTSPLRIVEHSLVYTNIRWAKPTADAPVVEGLCLPGSVAGLLDHVPGPSLQRTRKELGLIQSLLQILGT